MCLCTFYLYDGYVLSNTSSLIFLYNAFLKKYMKVKYVEYQIHKS